MEPRGARLRHRRRGVRRHRIRRADAWSAWVAGAAAVASAVGAYLGRQIVGSGDEAGWIQARATAEGIKSECYRYAARAGAYAVPDPDAAKALAARTAESPSRRPTRASCAPTIRFRIRATSASRPSR